MTNFAKIADLRNETAHTYKEAVAESLFAIAGSFRIFEKLLSKFKKQQNNQ